MWVAAGSGQLTAIADCDLLSELGWAELNHAQLQLLCVRIRGRVREWERGGKKEREPCKTASA